MERSVMKKLIASIFGILLVTGLAIAEPPDGKGNNKGDIEPGSIGLAEIDPTQVQVRVGGTCSVGRFIAAIAGDGSVTCENGTDSNENTVLGRSVFTSNSTGGHSNIAIGSQALRTRLDETIPQSVNRPSTRTLTASSTPLTAIARFIKTRAGVSMSRLGAMRCAA
jgi:hypothetical protein